MTDQPVGSSEEPESALDTGAGEAIVHSGTEPAAAQTTTATSSTSGAATLVPATGATPVPNPSVPAMSSPRVLARSTSALSSPKRIALGAAVVLCSLCFIGFWSATGLLLLEACGLILLAEGLEHTGGLVSEVYSAGFVLACLGVLGLLGASVHAFSLRAKNTPPPLWRRRPGVTAMVIGTPVLLMAVATDMNGVNLPDVLTTTALLAAAALLVFWLPVWSVTLWYRFTRWLWRQGNRSSYRAGLLTASGALLGTLCSPLVLGLGSFSTLAILADLEADSGWSLGPAADGMMLGNSSLIVVASGGVMAETYSGFIELSEVIDNDMDFGRGEFADASGFGGDLRFDQCINELMRGSPSEYDTAVGRISSRLFVGDAEDVATDKVLSVCSRHAAEPIRDLGPYYNRAVRNAVNDLVRNDDRELMVCHMDRYGTDQDPYARIRLREVEQAMCGLSRDNQEALFLVAEGLSGREIAARLGVTRDAGRQRVRRARLALSEALRRLDDGPSR